MSTPGDSPGGDKVKHTRTKTGCLTCRKRKKKCPGNYDAQGKCERCHNNESECIPAPPRPESNNKRPRLSTASASIASNHHIDHPTGNSSPIASTSATPFPVASSAHFHQHQSNGRASAVAGSAPGAHLFASTSTSTSLPATSAPSSALPPIASFDLPVRSPLQYTARPLNLGNPPIPTSESLSNSLDYFDSTLRPIADVSQMPDIDSFFESLNPAIDASNLTADWSIPVAATSASASSTNNHSTSHTPTSTTTTHFNAGTTHHQQNSPTTTTIANVQHNGSFASTSELASRHQPEDENTLAEMMTQLDNIPIYNALNDAFFSSMPKPVREILRRRMTSVAFSSDLGKSACLALCLLYRARTMEDDGSTETRERLIAQSNAYFQQAVEHLQSSQIPLEAKLLAVFDLQMHQLEQFDAAASYAILMLGDYFVTEAMGSRPRIDLSTLSGPSSVLLRSFAYADVLRSVCLRSQSTLFHLVGAPGNPPSSPEPATENDPPHPIVTSEALHLLGGLPMGLMLCLGATSNLAFERGLLSPADFNSRAKTIESAIKEWKAVDSSSSAEDSIRRMDDFITHEMWRQACLIYFYQSVHQLGPLSPVVRKALKQISALGTRTVETMNHDRIGTSIGVNGSVFVDETFSFSSVHSHRAAPWFLAGTVAVVEGERKLCREALKRCRPQKLAEQNLSALEKVWQVTDERGWPVNWKETLERQGLFVTFIC